MKRTSKIVIVTVITVVIAIIAFVFIEPYLNLIPKSELDSALRKSIQSNKGGGIVNLSDVTKFNWDRMDIYTPYSTYKDANGKTIDVDEGECLLVFSDKGSFVTLLKFKRFYGDFSDLYREGGYTPSNSRFKVVPIKDQNNWIKLEWAQSEGPTRRRQQ